MIEGTSQVARESPREGRSRQAVLTAGWTGLWSGSSYWAGGEKTLTHVIHATVKL